MTRGIKDKKRGKAGLQPTEASLWSDIRDLILDGRRSVARGVNAAPVWKNFEIGRRIVEHEQGGKKRADYAEETLESLSKKLTAEFGRSYSVDNLERMRCFYLMYRKSATQLRISSGEALPMARSQKSATVLRKSTFHFPLSWSHYLNPLIADLLHRIALIEKAGTGIRRMIEDARKHKCPEPKFTVNGFFTATFWPTREIARKVIPQVTEQVGEQVGEQVTPQVTPQVIAVLEAAQTARTRRELQRAVGLRDREHFRKTYLEPLLAAGWLEMTIPDKPRSSKQRYRTTDLGRKVLAQWNGGK